MLSPPRAATDVEGLARAATQTVHSLGRPLSVRTLRNRKTRRALVLRLLLLCGLFLLFLVTPGEPSTMPLALPLRRGARFMVLGFVVMGRRLRRLVRRRLGVLGAWLTGLHRSRRLVLGCRDMCACRRMRRIDAAMSPARECRPRARCAVLTGLRLRSLCAGDRGSNGKRGRREDRADYEGRGHFDLPGGVTLGDRRVPWGEVTSLGASQCEVIHNVPDVVHGRPTSPLRLKAQVGEVRLGTDA